MKYDLKKPCDACPFRSDKPFPLRYERVLSITRGLFSDVPFSCHKTTTAVGKSNRDKDAQHCAGALIFLEKNGFAHQLMRISERLGLYDPRKLDMSAPVHSDMHDMARECAKADGSWKEEE